MTDRDFEIRLERRLQSYAAVTIPPVDAASIAGSVAGRANHGLAVWADARLGLAGLAWVLLMLIVASMAALVVGSRLQAEAAPDRPLAFSTRLGGLFVATATGKDRIAIGSADRYADPRWSPDGGWIAVLHGNPASLEQLPDEELLIMRPTGDVVGRVAGPIRAFVWVDLGGAGPAVAAIRASDGRVIVLAANGRQLADLEPAAFPDRPTALAARSSPAGGSILVSAGRSLVEVSDLARGGKVGGAAVTVPDGRINAASVSPDGAWVAYVHADCDTNCVGEVILQSLVRGDARAIAVRIGADLVPSWTDSGDAVVVWPDMIPIDGGVPTAWNGDSRIRELDVGRWWTRAAPDGRGVWFFRQFPGYDDRRWELWAIDQPEASPRRLLVDITGADLRP